VASTSSLAFVLPTCAALAIGCAEGSMESGGGRSLLRNFADDYDAAMDERRRELPSHARTLDDIKLISRSRRLAAACAPGASQSYSKEWFEQNRDHELRTSRGRRTVDEMGDDCSRMLRKIEHRPVEACGARYVQLERHLTDDDAWTAPRVTRASDGWYMTPCDKTPGPPALKELKEAEEVIRSTCDEPKASFYLIARWSENPGGQGMVASVACLLPRQQRSDWLSGNPALGVK
jgi:hypothetical protein